MTLRLYNTLTRRLEDFAPLAPPAVTMYVCGPTVYDDPHIGHARSAYVFEVLRRYLEFKGFAVRFVRNVTDVDDKIIQKAHETSESCEAVAARYLASYHAMLTSLGLSAPTEEPKATEHVVPDMTDFIAKLLLQGAAYETHGGDVYFSVRKCPGYGKLSNRSVDELQAGTRVEPGEGKRDPLDFALWKAAKPGEPSWKSPWGAGRPGWHIECSAMSTKYLGDAFDIHGGGVDLVFPHHENEVAQAHAVGKPFARFWVHNGLLTVNGEKMSKSLGNFITVEKALEEVGNDADGLKMFFLLANYSSPLDYNSSALKTALGMMEKIDLFGLHAAQTNPFNEQEIAKNISPEFKWQIDQELQKFHEAMGKNLNTPMALAAMFEIIGLAHETLTENPPTTKGEISLLRYAWSHLQALLQKVFGMTGAIKSELREDVKLKAESLVQQREKARQRGDYKAADQIRDQLLKQGIVVDDTPSGPKLRKKLA